MPPDPPDSHRRFFDDETPAGEPPLPAESEPRPAPGGGLGAALARWARRLLLVGVVCAVIGAVGLWLVLSHYEKELPSTAELKHYAPPQVTRVLARDGTLLAELFVERRTVVPIGRIPRVMKVAVLAAEDADFYKHTGLDYLGMLRALWVNVRSASARQGGSTITQQVVKNVLLTHERTFERKARELLLARRIEQELSKDDILELYLNHIYFGHGRYGVEEAARYYFGKDVKDVTLEEAALIAGLPKGPSLYSPRVDPSRSRRRRDQVLEQMAIKGFASADKVGAAKRRPVVLAPAVESLSELAPEAVAEVQRQLRALVGPGAKKGGYTVTTTIDPELQAAARSAVRRNLDAYLERHHLVPPIARSRKGRPTMVPFQGTPKATGHHVYVAVVTGADDAEGLLRVRVGTADGTVQLRDQPRYNPKKLPPSELAERGALLRVSPIVERGIGDDGVPRAYRLELGPEGAMVAIDVASREVRALVGSYESVSGGLDRASFARRQPGSTFKPFVYGYGIHSRRLTAATVVEPPRPPGSSDDRPPLLLRSALARSVNSASLWSLRFLGAENVVSFAHSMGVRSPLGPTDSLALGAYELTPRELAGAYLVFASGGSYQPPVLVKRIVGPDGQDVRLPSIPPPRQVLDDAESYVVTDLLASVVQMGTGQRARALGIPLAGKTGTTNDSKDAWFAGYSPEMLCVTWTGYDDAVTLGRRETGATAALPAFIQFMRAAHQGRKVPDWKRPAGVLRVALDPKTGLLAYEGQEEVTYEIFVRGTEPTQIAEPPPDAADDPYAELGDAGAGEPVASAPPKTTPPAATTEPPPF